jgi:hypothetical protein
MPDVSIFNVAGTAINVKDATARSQAANALSAAKAAQTTVTQALNLAQSIEDLTRVEVTYESASETIKITNGTHES